MNENKQTTRTMLWLAHRATTSQTSYLWVAKEKTTDEAIGARLEALWGESKKLGSAIEVLGADIAPDPIVRAEPTEQQRYRTQAERDENDGTIR